MTQPNEHLIRQLHEARELELALSRTLQARVAITPAGSYRKVLESHLQLTRKHAGRIERRLKELGDTDGLFGSLITTAGDVAAQIGGLAPQLLALPTNLLALLGVGSPERQLLANAQDECAAAAHEVATFLALEQLATQAQDAQTTELAVGIRAQQERTLQRLFDEITHLARAVYARDVLGTISYDVTATGAADALRSTRRAVRDLADDGEQRARGAARQARNVPGIAQLEGEVKGALANVGDLAISAYDEQTAEQVLAHLPRLSQIELAKIDAYERKHASRSTILNRIYALRAAEPWPGYDELGVEAVASALEAADEEQLETVRTYEQRHKDRVGVIRAAERQRSRS